MFWSALKKLTNEKKIQTCWLLLAVWNKYYFQPSLQGVYDTLTLTKKFSGENSQITPNDFRIDVVSQLDARGNWITIHQRALLWSWRRIHLHSSGLLMDPKAALAGVLVILMLSGKWFPLLWICKYVYILFRLTWTFFLKTKKTPNTCILHMFI